MIFKKITKTIIAFFVLVMVNNISMAMSWLSTGNYSISWYNSSQMEFVISTNKELAGVAYLVNNGYTKFENKIIKLNGDIDLSSNYWVAIGLDEYNYFQGTIDGQGYSIKGLNIELSSGDNTYYGFMGYSKSSVIKNVSFTGDVHIEENEAYYTSRYIGSIIGYASDCSLIKVKSYINVSYKRLKTGSFKYGEYVGGLVGRCQDTSISYCLHYGDVDAQLGKHTTIYVPNAESYIGVSHYVGGLVGYMFNNSQIEFSENYSSKLSATAGDSQNTNSGYRVHIGGIVGCYYSGRNSTIRCCKSEVSEIEAIYNGNDDGIIYLGGICGVCELQPLRSKILLKNTLAITPYFHAGSSTNYTSVYYGGITGKQDEDAVQYMSANYCNSEYELNQTSLHKTMGYNGSTAFASFDMKSDLFLEELNLYPIIELGKTVWSREDGYPFISELYETGIKTIFKDIENQNVYNISGQPLEGIKKGIQIINGRKVFIK